MTQNNEAIRTAAPPPDHQIKPELPPAPPRKKRILVVDDDVSITRLLKLNLEQTGGFVVRTENCSDAVLAAAATFTPDLILLDIMMPGVSGDNLAQSLRANPKTATARIVFLTALAEPNKPYTGPDRILSKPVNTDDVLRCCRQELGG